MKQLFLCITLLCSLIFSTFSFAGVYNVICIKKGSKPSLTHVKANTNTGEFLFGSDMYYNEGEQVSNNTISINYKSKQNKNSILLLIDTVNNTSRYMISNGSKVFENGVCMIDNSVII